jgi:hypothetical protein
LNFTCANIVHVEIEETCPVLRTGRDHKGGEKFQQAETIFLLKNSLLKGSQK